MFLSVMGVVKKIIKINIWGIKICTLWVWLIITRYNSDNCLLQVEMFYLNTIEQLFLLVEQLDQLEVCLTYNRLLAGIPILPVFQNLRWNSNKTSLLRFSTSK